jgi:hypothetical protein
MSSLARKKIAAAKAPLTHQGERSRIAKIEFSCILSFMPGILPAFGRCAHGETRYAAPMRARRLD